MRRSVAALLAATSIAVLGGCLFDSGIEPPRELVENTVLRLEVEQAGEGQDVIKYVNRDGEDAAMRIARGGKTLLTATEDAAFTINGTRFDFSNGRVRAESETLDLEVRSAELVRLGPTRVQVCVTKPE